MSAWKTTLGMGTKTTLSFHVIFPPTLLSTLEYPPLRVSAGAAWTWPSTPTPTPTTPPSQKLPKRSPPIHHELLKHGRVSQSLHAAGSRMGDPTVPGALQGCPHVSWRGGDGGGEVARLCLRSAGAPSAPPPQAQGGPPRALLPRRARGPGRRGKAEGVPGASHHSSSSSSSVWSW